MFHSAAARFQKTPRATSGRSSIGISGRTLMRPAIYSDMSAKHLEQVYDSYAKIYDVVFGRTLQSGREMEPELLDVFPGAAVLEAGVGTGLSLTYWNKNIDITAIDLSQKMLDQAQKRIRKRGMDNVRLMKMDATQLEFPDNSFDRVLAAYFISAVPNPVQVVLEMKRVCRPGGYLVFLNHFQSDNRAIGFLEKVVSPLFYRLGFRTDLNLRELMKATGLRVETLRKVDFLGHWKAVRCINHKPEQAEG
jgi:phosphatidylethanolamine/phosphatidyl-N-methylethanolamine N-methyltransferase